MFLRHGTLGFGHTHTVYNLLSSTSQETFGSSLLGFVLCSEAIPSKREPTWDRLRSVGGDGGEGHGDTGDRGKIKSFNPSNNDWLL